MLLTWHNHPCRKYSHSSHNKWDYYHPPIRLYTPHTWDIWGDTDGICFLWVKRSFGNTCPLSSWNTLRTKGLRLENFCSLRISTGDWGAEECRYWDLDMCGDCWVGSNCLMWEGGIRGVEGPCRSSWLGVNKRVAEMRKIILLLETILTKCSQ